MKMLTTNLVCEGNSNALWEIWQIIYDGRRKVASPYNVSIRNMFRCSVNLYHESVMGHTNAIG